MKGTISRNSSKFQYTTLLRGYIEDAKKMTQNVSCIRFKTDDSLFHSDLFM